MVEPTKFDSELTEFLISRTLCANHYHPNVLLQLVICFCLGMEFVKYTTTLWVIIYGVIYSVTVSVGVAIGKSNK